MQAVVVGKKTGVLVNVPDPARFVLHKLWTSRVRGPAWRSTARKDLLQAGLLLEVLLDDRSEDLALAGEVLARQPAALRLTRRGADDLAEELRERLFAELPSSPIVEGSKGKACGSSTGR